MSKHTVDRWIYTKEASIANATKPMLDENGMDTKQLYYCNAIFKDHDFINQNLDRCHFYFCDFSNAKLMNVSLANTVFYHCRLVDCQIGWLYIGNTRFEGCQFSKEVRDNIMYHCRDINEFTNTNLSKQEIKPSIYNGVFRTASLLKVENYYTGETNE